MNQLKQFLRVNAAQKSEPLFFRRIFFVRFYVAISLTTALGDNRLPIGDTWGQSLL